MPPGGRDKCVDLHGGTWLAPGAGLARRIGRSPRATLDGSGMLAARGLEDDSPGGKRSADAGWRAPAVYVDMMIDEGVDRIKTAYRDNYDRLVRVKNRYDPTNLFHVNQNIKPSS